MVSKDKERITINIPKSLSLSLRDISDNTGFTLSAVAVLAITAGLAGKKMGETIFDKVVKSDGNDKD